MTNNSRQWSRPESPLEWTISSWRGHPEGGDPGDLGGRVTPLFHAKQPPGARKEKPPGDCRPGPRATRSKPELSTPYPDRCSRNGPVQAVETDPFRATHGA